jgi:hypothetical protein
MPTLYETTDFEQRCERTPEGTGIQPNSLQFNQSRQEGQQCGAAGWGEIAARRIIEEAGYRMRRGYGNKPEAGLLMVDSLNNVAIANKVDLRSQVSFFGRFMSWR